MITFGMKDGFKSTRKFLSQNIQTMNTSFLHDIGKRGVNALASATPVDTGNTADSWSYKIIKRRDSVSIRFINNNTTDTGIPIAILLQYGHGTRNGGYVEGIDYIKPPLRKLFRLLADNAWKEISRR